MTGRLLYMHAAATLRIVLMKFYSKTRPYIHIHHLINEKESVCGTHLKGPHYIQQRNSITPPNKTKQNKKTSNVNSSTRGTHINTDSRDTEDMN